MPPGSGLPRQDIPSGQLAPCARGPRCLNSAMRTRYLASHGRLGMARQVKRVESVRALQVESPFVVQRKIQSGTFFFGCDSDADSSVDPLDEGEC